MKIVEREGKFVISDFNQLEAYLIACKIEKDGIRFYQKLSEKEKNLQIKKTLESVMEEEKKHLEFFESSLDALRQRTEDDRDDNDLLTSIDYGIFQPYESIEDLNQLIKSREQALKLAIALERKSINFYVASQEKVSSELTKTELARITEEEKKHLELFENMLIKCK